MGRLSNREPAAYHTAGAEGAALRGTENLSGECPLCAKSRHSGRFWILLLAGKGAQVRGASPVKLPRRTLLHLAAGAAALPEVLRIAWAQAYPTRPVRVVVGQAAGSGSDAVARLIGQFLSERFGQQFVIENRPGAGGNIATEAVVRSPPDGYTLLLVNTGSAIDATLYDKLNFDVMRDITPIAGIAIFEFVIEVNPSVPTKTLPEFIAYAKANPGKINMASAGIGSAHHLFGELFKMMAGVEMVHVPYRGSTPALTDLLGGRVQVMFDATTSSLPHISSGKLRPLAVTTATRSELLPDIPTIGDFVPGYEAHGWIGFGAPKNTPAAVVDRLNNEINAAISDSSIKARLIDLGGLVLPPSSPADFGKLIADETEKWAKVIRAANVRPE
jgi:tripartite-type tricarboxylate transporter receptor subunit TctC